MGSFQGLPCFFFLLSLSLAYSTSLFIPPPSSVQAPFLYSVSLQVSEFSGKLLHKQFHLTPYLHSDRIRKSVSATTTTAVMMTARMVKGSEFINILFSAFKEKQASIVSWIITNSEIRKPAVQMTIILVSQISDGESMKDVIQSM